MDKMAAQQHRILLSVKQRRRLLTKGKVGYRKPAQLYNVGGHDNYRWSRFADAGEAARLRALPLGVAGLLLLLLLLLPLLLATL